MANKQLLDKPVPLQPCGGPEHVSVPAVSKRAPPVSISASTVIEEPHSIKSLCANLLWAWRESLSLSPLRQSTKTLLTLSSTDYSASNGATLSYGSGDAGKNIIHMFCVNGWMGFGFLFLCTPRCLSASFYHDGDSVKCFPEREQNVPQGDSWL